MDGVYSALGETDVQQQLKQLCIRDDKSWQRKFCVDKWIWKITYRCAHQNPLRDWSLGRRCLVGFPHYGLRQLIFLLLIMVMGSSRSSEVQFAFSWTQFPCVPQSERISVWESTGSVHHSSGSRSAFTQCNIVEETEASSFCSWVIKAERSKWWCSWM